MLTLPLLAAMAGAETIDGSALAGSGGKLLRLVLHASAGVLAAALHGLTVAPSAAAALRPAAASPLPLLSALPAMAMARMSLASPPLALAGLEPGVRPAPAPPLLASGVSSWSAALAAAWSPRSWPSGSSQRGRAMPQSSCAADLGAGAGGAQWRLLSSAHTVAAAAAGCASAAPRPLLLCPRVKLPVSEPSEARSARFSLDDDRLAGWQACWICGAARATG